MLVDSVDLKHVLSQVDPNSLKHMLIAPSRSNALACAGLITLPTWMRIRTRAYVLASAWLGKQSFVSKA